MERKIFIFISLAILLGLSVGQSCTSETTCSDCIQNGPNCQWCKDKEFQSDRCMDTSTIAQFQDKCSDWVNPKSEVNSDTSGFTNIRQVQPTAITLKLRPGEDYTVPVTVKSSQNYPLDMYYLMDFSFSMNDDLEQLKILAAKIGDELVKISSNYSIGFGTFVDKPTSPYVNTEPESLAQPCNSNNQENKCQPAHAFNHEMDLTLGTNGANQKFKNKLNDVKISSNIDNPEGGFDAIVQACVCKDVIGWRTLSRKVIFFATDAVFHMAGDGKLAGIVEANSGTCGMTSNKYTKSLEEDYPSIGQLNDVLIKHGVMPIFAVTEGMKPLYNKLSSYLTQLSTVGKLDEASKDIELLIKQQLEKLIATAKLNPQAPPGTTVKVVPKCSGTQVEVLGGCTNVKIEEEVLFDVTFRVEECSKTSADNKKEFKIDIPGIDSIDVKIEMICECACEAEETGVSELCGGHGNLTCGACQCIDTYFGDKCQCDQTTEQSTETCKNPETGSICGGTNNGRCVCGKCKCISPTSDNFRYGDYCECSNYECPRNRNNDICSNNGYCDCGVCDCEKDSYGILKPTDAPKFTGIECACSSDKTECISNAETGEECSGNGVCQCGQCECNSNHYGQYCDICPDCGPLDCDLYIECVKCVYEDKKDTTWQDCNCTHDTSISLYDRVDTSKLSRHKQCESIPIEGNEDCSIVFYLSYKDISPTVQPTLYAVLIDKVPDCVSAPNITVIVIGLIGGIVGIGLLMLIVWKQYVSIMDKREFKKFMEERSKAKWNSGLSPIYKEPMTKYTNPIYAAAKSKI